MSAVSTPWILVGGAGGERWLRGWRRLAFLAKKFVIWFITVYPSLSWLKLRLPVSETFKVTLDFALKNFGWYERQYYIHHFHIKTIVHLCCPQNSAKPLFPVSPGYYSRPKTNIQDNGYAKFGAINKLHYGLC